MSDSPRRLSVVLFDGFELLDVFGPMEMFGVLRDHFLVTLVGPDAGPVRSAQGPQVIADYAYEEAPTSEIILVPGGRGTRKLVGNQRFLDWLGQWAAQAEYVTSVCTGSGVLAAAGLLREHRATSNKRAFDWARQQGHDVEWVAEARWVEDRNRWTSSGVAAGMDMALALIAHLAGQHVASTVADAVEYDWHQDARWDPFAAMNGLVEPHHQTGPGEVPAEGCVPPPNS